MVGYDSEGGRGKRSGAIVVVMASGQKFDGMCEGDDTRVAETLSGTTHNIASH